MTDTITEIVRAHPEFHGDKLALALELSRAGFLASEINQHLDAALDRVLSETFEHRRAA